LGLSVVFYIGYTIFTTPLIGLGYEMSPDYNERTRLMAVSQWMGQIAWMIAPWFWFELLYWVHENRLIKTRTNNILDVLFKIPIKPVVFIL